MSKNKWMDKLQKLAGAVEDGYDPFDHVLRSSSPSFNFIFGNSWGLPFGFTTILWGPAKSGKSLCSYALAAQLQKDDPEALIVRFDTEMRSQIQLTPQTAEKWGIDLNRFVRVNANKPSDIFDQIENEIKALIQDGAPVRMIIIDSISGIRGRRELNADTIDTMQIGDHAMTLQEGLKRILETIRTHNIALVLCAHSRAEMDAAEVRRGITKKMAAANAAQHFAEYFVYVERNNSKEGRQDLMGQEFVDESLSDLMDKGESTGHKIRVKMNDSSLGPKGRVGEFTFSYQKGIINQHEEVFRLGVNRGLITKPNNMTYEYKGVKWVGKATALAALKNSVDMQEAIVSELIDRDRNGFYSAQEDVLQSKEEIE